MAGKANKGSFKKGDPRAGRPKGTENKATVEIRVAARAFIEDPKGQAKMLALYQAGKLNPAIITLLHQYAYGKPKDTVEISGPDGSPLSAIARVIVDASRDDAQD